MPLPRSRNQPTTLYTPYGLETLYSQMQAKEVFQDSVTWPVVAPGVLNAEHIYWGPLQFHAVVTPKASIQLTIFSIGITGVRRFLNPIVNVPGVAFQMENMNNMANVLNPLYIYPNPVIAADGFAQEGGKIIPANTIYKTDWFKPMGSINYMWQIYNAATQGDAIISVEVTVRSN